MATHLQRHHPGVSLTGVKPKAAQQPLITAAFKQPLPPQSDRAKAIKQFIFFADPKNDPIRDSDPRNDPNREFFDPLHP